jgi:hypothetical protein
MRQASYEMVGTRFGQKRRDGCSEQYLHRSLIIETCSALEAVLARALAMPPLRNLAASNSSPQGKCTRVLLLTLSRKERRGARLLFTSIAQSWSAGVLPRSQRCERHPLWSSPAEYHRPPAAPNPPSEPLCWQDVHSPLPLQGTLALQEGHYGQRSLRRFMTALIKRGRCSSFA